MASSSALPIFHPFLFKIEFRHTPNSYYTCFFMDNLFMDAKPFFVVPSFLRQLLIPVYDNACGCGGGGVPQGENNK